MSTLETESTNKRKRYKCIYCYRLIGEPVSHTCNGTCRKRHLKFYDTSLSRENYNYNSRIKQVLFDLSDGFDFSENESDYSPIIKHLEEIYGICIKTIQVPENHKIQGYWYGVINLQDNTQIDEDLQVYPDILSAQAAGILEALSYIWLTKKYR